MAYDFESGDSDYVTRATPIFTGTNNWSMSAWFKLESTGSGVVQSIIVNGVDGAYGQGFGMVVDNDVLKGLFPYVTWIGGSSSLSTGAWYHACFVRNSGTAQLYLDGSTAGSSSASSPYSLDPASDTVIGARRTTTPGFDWYFDGLLSRVAMWDRALDGSEITALAGGAEATDYSTNLLFYKLFSDESEARTDEVDTYTNWTIGNTPVYSSDDPIGVIETASVSPIVATFSMPAVTAIDASPYINIENHRWRDDNGSETTASWLAGSGVNITRAIETNTRLRFIVSGFGNNTPAEFQLEYREKASGDPWKKVR